MHHASDIMSREVVAVDADQTVDEAIALFVERGISGAPVIEGGRLVGIVSELELFDVLFDPRIRQLRVRDVMSSDVVAVDAADELSKVAHLFAAKRVRRVPVMQDGGLVGVLSRRDLLRFSHSFEDTLVDPLTELMNSIDEA